MNTCWMWAPATGWQADKWWANQSLTQTFYAPPNSQERACNIHHSMNTQHATRSLWRALRWRLPLSGLVVRVFPQIEELCRIDGHDCAGLVDATGREQLGA
jgi:hypothetical protein